jgi:diguanylate cyclase (GGDEF)-like protein/PAS domain S-box-containing protein
MYYTNKVEKKSILFFIVFFGFSMIGSLLIYYRNDITMFFGIILANVFLLSARLCLVCGTRTILGMKRYPILNIGILIIYLIPILIFTYIDYNTFFRAAFYSVFIIIVLLLNLHAIAKNNVKNPILQERLMFGIIIFVAVVELTRLIVLIIMRESTDDYLAYRYDSVFIVIVGLSNLLIPTGIYSMINNKQTIKLSDSERSKNSLLSNLPGFAYRCRNDEYWTMIFLSDGFEALTGYKKEDILNNNLLSYEDLIVPTFREEVRKDWNKTLKEKNRYTGEYKIRCKNEDEIWILEQGVGVFNVLDELEFIEGFISNIDKRKKLEQNLEIYSYKDSLTNLYNRRYLEEQIKRLNKSRNGPISVIMADINGLKFTNDTFGHKMGDKLIKTISTVLCSTLRGNEIIARTGGDEFTIILENTNIEQVKVVLNRLKSTIKKTKCENLPISISFGEATRIDNQTSLQETIAKAEDKMYSNKTVDRIHQAQNQTAMLLHLLYELDPYGKNHAENVANLASQFGSFLSLKKEEITVLEQAAQLHDIGKIKFPRELLESAKKFTPTERKAIKEHSAIGSRILASIPTHKQISHLVLCHHEFYNGKGYPNHLVAEEIPYLSRIINIVDAYDAMTNKRFYQKTRSKQEAIDELKRCKGSQFDPKITDEFIAFLQNK